MLFNSFEFIFIFLPLVVIAYFNFFKFRALIILLASLTFYSWWNVSYLPLLVISVLFNYWIGKSISDSPRSIIKKYYLIVGLVFNISLLGYYKYANFISENIEAIFSTNIAMPQILLPLAISFFTFQQIAYLVDNFRGSIRKYSLLDYSVFVTFFPQLIAGPIVHHSEMMPQFSSKSNYKFNPDNFSIGVFLFILGLVKKVMIADELSTYVGIGYSSIEQLNAITAWTTSLCYTFQIYFDFSGYTDMALGVALMFNIKLPKNFDSPYKSLSIQEFWRRWHITLSRFLRDYIYIPLGGNRVSSAQIYFNLVITFLIGGIWHGANWTFLLWGACHGLALVVHRVWSRKFGVLPKILSWFITMLFINATWVLFRADSINDAMTIFSKMLFIGEVFNFSLAGGVEYIRESFQSELFIGTSRLLLVNLLLGSGLICVLCKNSNQLIESVRLDGKSGCILAGMLYFAIISMFTVKSEFLYFNF